MSPDERVDFQRRLIAASPYYGHEHDHRFESVLDEFEEAVRREASEDIRRERDELKFLLERLTKRFRDRNKIVCGVVHAKRQLGLIGPQMKRPFFKEIWPQVMAFINAHGGIDIK